MANYGGVSFADDDDDSAFSFDDSPKPRVYKKALIRERSIYTGFRANGAARQCSIKAGSTVTDLEVVATKDDIDIAIDLVDSDSAGTDVIRQFKPSRAWLWRQWYGTVFQYGLWYAFFYMCIGLMLSLAIHYYEIDEDGDNIIADTLSAVNGVWKYMLTITTFILTFFINQSYAVWQRVYTLARQVQGRTNDFGLLCAAHVKRKPCGKYAPESLKLLEDQAMCIRLFHTFVYASKTRRYKILHTKRALNRMVDRGMMTQEMLDALLSADLSENMRPYVVLEWIMVRWTMEFKNKTLQGGFGLETLLLEKACLLRSVYGTFSDVVDARMPLAYVHFVQVMVDLLLITAPFSLYSEMGPFCIAAVGILALFFEGLMILSKVFLDPFDNEDYCDGVIEMNIGVYIRESNHGSTRFIKAATHMPVGWCGKFEPE